MVQGVPACHLSIRSSRAELAPPVLSSFPLKVVLATTEPDSYWRDLVKIHGPGDVLFNLRQADADCGRGGVGAEQHNHKSLVKLDLHPVTTSIEQVKWLPTCGLMTWTEVTIDRIREGDRNKSLNALMAVSNEHGSLGSILASLLWNYDLMKALYDNP